MAILITWSIKRGDDLRYTLLMSVKKIKNEKLVKMIEHIQNSLKYNQMLVTLVLENFNYYLSIIFSIIFIILINQNRDKENFKRPFKSELFVSVVEIYV